MLLPNLKESRMVTMDEMAMMAETATAAILVIHLIHRVTVEMAMMARRVEETCISYSFVE